MFVVCGTSHSLTAPGSQRNRATETADVLWHEKQQLNAIISMICNYCISTFSVFFFDCALFGACHSVLNSNVKPSKGFFLQQKHQQQQQQQAITNAAVKPSVLASFFFALSHSKHRLSTSIFTLEDIFHLQTLGKSYFSNE